jgi:hypothetical protein
MYAYHANRVLAPLLALSWLIINRQQVVKRWRLSLAVGGLSLLLLWPLTARLNTAQVRQRFNETSVFSDLTPIINSNELIAADGSGLGAKLLHHRYWQYLSLFADHYLDQFTVSFLFLSGDTNPRHSTQTSGQLYLTLLPLMLLGAYYLWYSRRSDFYWFTSWLLLAPIPAALTRATPHALRSLALVIPLVVLAAIGLVRLFYFKRLWAVIALLLVSFEFTRFWVNYQGSYRTRFSDQWQYGYQQLVELINQHYGSYDNIYVTRTVGRPSIYYWFYSATEPLKVQVINNTVSKDQGEYLEFAKIKFTQPPSITTGSSLIVSTSDQMGFGELLTIITDLSGKKVFYVYEKN